MFIVEVRQRKKPRRGDMSGFHAAPNGARVLYWLVTINMQPRWGRTPLRRFVSSSVHRDRIARRTRCRT
jgi:hypothetical protein